MTYNIALKELKKKLWEKRTDIQGALWNFRTGASGPDDVVKTIDDYINFKLIMLVDLMAQQTDFVDVHSPMERKKLAHILEGVSDILCSDRWP